MPGASAYVRARLCNGLLPPQLLIGWLVHAGFGVCLLPALTVFLVEGALDGIDFFATDHGTRRTVALVADQYLRIAPFKGFIEALQAAGRNIVLPPIRPWPEPIKIAGDAARTDEPQLLG
jgi:hypothetical protein